MEFGGGGADEAALRDFVKDQSGIERALVHAPAQARDPFLHDGAPPPLVAQIYFATLPQPGEALARLPPSKYEAMLVHRFEVAEPGIRSDPWCTYLVRYAGPAEDADAWHAHYLAHHPQLMARLPGIRELEIYVPLDWAGTLPGERVRSLQRNKVAFESPAALTAALNSPVREAMRADYAKFPPFTGRVTHFPMLTREINVVCP